MNGRFRYYFGITLLFFGISVLGACSTPVRHVTATRTVEAGKVATAIAATRTAEASNVATAIAARPAPYARLIAPQFAAKQRVPMQATAVVEYRDIPPARYLWIVVRIPKVIPNWLVYPQVADGMPREVIGSGTFSTTVGLGTDADSGQLFNLVVLLLNAEANRSFVEYAALCQAKQSCGGIALPDSGVTILDFNTLIRE
ncbi:MAG: hypothetical protein U0350_36600 [Caldilineaceae bacterium]